MGSWVGRFGKTAGTGRALLIGAAVCLALSGCGGSKEKYAFRDEAVRKLETGDYAGALELLDQALESSDGFVGDFELDVLKYRAQAEYASGDYAAAAGTYGILCQVDGERPEYLERLGQLCAAEGRTEEAAQAYRKLLEVDPDNDGADRILLLAGDRLIQSGRAEEAAALLLEAVNGGRESGALYNQLAVSEIEAGEYDRALEYIQKGLDLQDEDEARAQLLYNQAAALEGKRDYAGALRSLETYAREFGSDPDVEKETAFLRTRTEQAARPTAEGVADAEGP